MKANDTLVKLLEKFDGNCRKYGLSNFIEDDDKIFDEAFVEFTGKDFEIVSDLNKFNKFLSDEILIMKTEKKRSKNANMSPFIFHQCKRLEKKFFSSINEVIISNYIKYDLEKEMDRFNIESPKLKKEIQEYIQYYSIVLKNKDKKSTLSEDEILYLNFFFEYYLSLYNTFEKLRNEFIYTNLMVNEFWEDSEILLRVLKEVEKTVDNFEKKCNNSKFNKIVSTLKLKLNDFEEKMKQERKNELQKSILEDLENAKEALNYLRKKLYWLTVAKWGKIEYRKLCEEFNTQNVSEELYNKFESFTCQVTLEKEFSTEELKEIEQSVLCHKKVFLMISMEDYELTKNYLRTIYDYIYDLEKEMKSKGN